MSDEIHQLACIFCGRNRPLTQGFRLGTLTVDPSEYGVITIRSVGPGPGRGHIGERGEGLRTIDRLNMKEALEDPQFSDIAGQVRERIIAIVRSYVRAGIISMEEINV